MFPEMDDGAHDSDGDPFGDDCAQIGDDDTERNDDDVSETELSKINLYNGIKKMVEKSVEIIRKHRTERKKKRKRTNGNGGDACYNRQDTNAYIRCTLPYLAKVIQSITCSDHRISLVKKMGFEETLHIDDCYIPRLFAQWIADKIKPDAQVIQFDEKSIPINPKSFQDVLGIPAGLLPVLTDEDSGKAAFLGFFGLSEVPTIKYFGEKIINNDDLGDDEFCMCYGAVVLSTFLCPNSSPRPSTKYLGALADVENIGNRNWCQFVHDWMMWYIQKYLKERAKQNKLTLTLGGCIYHLAVRYLDFIDLGPINLPSTLPRIRVWKGDLIKHFSEMDRGNDGNYGSHTIKDVSETCYAPPSIATTQYECGHDRFKNQIATVTGEHMSKEVKDDLFNAFQSHMVDASPENYQRAQVLVIDFLKIIVSEGVTKTTSERTMVGSQGSTDLDHEAVHKGKKQRCNASRKEDYVAETNIEVDTNSQGKLDGSCQQKQVTETKDVFTDQAKTIEATVTRMRSFSPNHTPSTDEGGSCSVTCNRQVKPSVSEKEVSKSQPEEVKRQGRFINTMPCLVQDYIQGADPKPSDFATREEYLKEASKKYFFYDPSYPSMRLFEDEDDNGKHIEEPELWRPLPGDIIEKANSNVQKVQEKFKVGNLNDVPQDDENSCEVLGSQFEVNISNEKLEMNDGLIVGYNSPPYQGNTSYVYSPPKQHTTAYKSNADSEFEFSSIQCAQRQPSYSLPKQKVDETKEIIDLDPSTPPSQPSKLTPTRKESPKSCMKGRRLFDSGSSSAGNENTPNKPNYKKLKQQMSPEVEYLGERSFNTVCNNMAEKTDDLYNAGLTLGSASMPFGKENLPPKRVINRSNWLRSPYENNQRPVLNPKHVRLHEILTTLCDDPQYQ